MPLLSMPHMMLVGYEELCLFVLEREKERVRSSILKRTVRSVIVIIDTPFFEFPICIIERKKRVLRDTFFKVMIKAVF